MQALLESPSDWAIILIVVVVLFGGSQLPKLARNLGQAQKEFKKGLKEGEKGKADAAKADGAKSESADASSATDDKN